ncbi:MAG: hypothetical protein ACYTG1_00710 [Planctomycetota bacterium]|jgi:hypothetical protein
MAKPTTMTSPGPASPERAAARARVVPWLMIGLFVFVAFESSVLAAAMKGPWLILLAPATVCIMRAIDTWKDMRRAARRDGPST